jgi:hypothetical protein
VGDLELDEDELAQEMAANAPQADPEFEDPMQQNGLTREQQQQEGAADVEMQDVQQENVPPAGNSQQQQPQVLSQGGEKQAAAGGKQVQEAAGTQQQAQPRKTTISAEKYEFVKVSIRSGVRVPFRSACVSWAATACCASGAVV